jgi:hypothetical protein
MPEKTFNIIFGFSVALALLASKLIVDLSVVQWSIATIIGALSALLLCRKRIFP